jgi:hypothetical protein
MEVLATGNFQPDIIVNGLRIGEPVIALTGLLVALICFYAWQRLGRIESPSEPLKLSRLFFLFTGLSTFIGGLVGHAFLYALPFEYKLPGWISGMIAVSALEQAAIVQAQWILGQRMVKMLSWINIVELTLALWLISSSLWFPVVEIHSAFGFLLIVAPLQWLIWRKSGAKGSTDILLGILLLIGAVVAHIFKISMGPWFSFFDFAHLFMGAAMWKIMTGAENSTPLRMQAITES